jgi:hypothetical protein
MSITNGYCTLEDARAAMSIDDLNDDARIEAIITAVSRKIDIFTRRRFWTTSSDEARYYTPLNAESVYTDDIISVASIATDSDGSGSFATAWVSTDYRLSPYNASADGVPYTEIQVTRNGSKWFPVIERSVKVTGKFGVISTSPWQDVVREACLLQVHKTFKRKDSPFGVAGSNELGQLQMLKSKLDPDVELLLAPPVRRLRNG